MKFSVTNANLLSHLQTISRVINSKNSLPILDNFLFNLHDGMLTITAADLETTLVTNVLLNSSEGAGVVALSAKIMLDTLKEFPDVPLDFTINDESFATEIKTESGTYSLIGCNPDEFPTMRQLSDQSKTITVPANILNVGITSTSFATNEDDLRPVMCGVLFDITTENLTFVATDGHKLVRIRTTTSKGEENCSMVLPKKPISFLKAILPKEGTNNVKVQFDDNNVYFQFSDYQMICRLIEGNFPNYVAVIPTNNPYNATVERTVLLSALRRLSVYASQSTNLVKMEFGMGNIICSSQDFDFNISATEKVPCSYEGEPVTIGFKCSIMADMLSNITSENVTIELSDPTRAGLIIPVEKSETEDVLMLLMPMQIPD